VKEAISILCGDQYLVTKHDKACWWYKI